MSTPANYEEYQRIQEQIAVLQAKSKALQEALLSDEIKAIKLKIKEFGLKPQQLFSAAVLAGEVKEEPTSMGEKIAKAAKTPTEVKYRGPNGETWSGGRGRKPGWVQAIVDAGGNIEDYKV